MIATACLLLALAADPEGASPAPADPTPGPATTAPASADSSPAHANQPYHSGGARLFDTWSLGLDAGLFLPASRLADVLDPAPVLGFRLESSYYGPWRAWASVDLARLDGAASPAAVGMASGATGLAWRSRSAIIPSPGIGLAFHYARALGRDAAADEYLFLEDGESEFGSRAVLRWTLPLGESLDLSAGARWETMFTAPGYGHAFAIHLGAAWKRP